MTISTICSYKACSMKPGVDPRGVADDGFPAGEDLPKGGRGVEVEV
jgi:hypothetical protein